VHDEGFTRARRELIKRGLNSPQLLARGLEYRMRGAGAPDEARHTIEELTRIREPLGPDDDALRAFLLAEALDVVQGGGAGLHELEATRAVVGDHPLVALGLAERLLSTGQHTAAVDAFHLALGGPLLDLRRPGVIAIVAADAAVRCSRLEEAAWFLDVAASHEETHAAAAARRAQLVDLYRLARRSTPAPEDVAMRSADTLRPRPSLPVLAAAAARVRKAHS